MKRVLIIGGNGAGKTTFSYKLSAKAGLPLIHIDKIYWRNHWEVTPREEFEKIILSEEQKPCWIIEGNNIRSLEQRLQYADTVFWFEFPPLICVINLLRRHIKYRKKARPDMPDGCTSRMDLDFLKTAWKFNQRNHARIVTLLHNSDDIDVIRFTNYRQVRKYLRTKGE